MGLFDDITCEMPLPERPEGITSFQTKDTPAQFMDRYEIRADGTLWHEDHDLQWGGEGDEFGFRRVGKKWVHEDRFDGCIDFYALVAVGGWIEYRCVFVDGKVVKGPVLTVNRPPAPSPLPDTERGRG